MIPQDTMSPKQSDRDTAELTERIALLRLKCKKAIVQLESRLEEDLRALLGHPCETSCTSPEYITQEEYSKAVTGTDSFWAVYSFQVGARGRVVLRFPFEVGATLSGLLLVMADSRILEKVEQKELTEEDMDVLEEVANQLRGIFMRTLQKAVHNDVHLTPQYFIRSSDQPETFPSGRACRFSVNLQIPGLLNDAFEIAVDFDALAQLFRVDISAKDLERLEAAKTGGQEEKPQSHSGTAVLIASDADAQDSLRAGIEATGLRVVRVPDFQELSNAVRSGLITAVVIDASEGVDKGLKLARVLRSFSPRCALVVGAARWSREHVLESIQAGVDVLLTQPYDPGVTAEKIAKALEQRKSGRLQTVT